MCYKDINLYMCTKLQVVEMEIEFMYACTFRVVNVYWYKMQIRKKYNSKHKFCMFIWNSG